MALGLDAVVRLDLRRHLVQLGLRARHELHVDAFGGQRSRDRKADALRRSGDQRAAAAQIEVHVPFPFEAATISPNRHEPKLFD